ncbi:MAG: LutC/YkgG family protein [Ardenticatenaceae bacterium]
MTSSRDEFFQNIRRALGRESGTPNVVPDESTYLSDDASTVEARAQSVRQFIEQNADDLMAQLEKTALEAGWKLKRVTSAQEAASYVRALAQGIEARSILRSAHAVLEKLALEEILSGTGIDLGIMAVTSDAERESQRQALREAATRADIGITGVDYAIAETGTAVLLPRKGVSRVVSLLPPVHVAIVERGQVLPSLDELFTLRRADFLHSKTLDSSEGGFGSYISLITGPSRSADIEYTLVTGVHGPREVHMILIG